MAVEVLISRGVPEERILFLNIIASPQGIEKFAKRFPKLRVVTSFIDQVRGESGTSSLKFCANSCCFTGSRREDVCVL